MISKLPSPRATGILLAALLASAINAQVTMTQVWDSVDHPASVEASVVAVNKLSDQLGTTTMYTYEVNCPAAASPENDNCRSRQFYPQQWVHTQGSMFEGTATAVLENSTTTWTCALGGCPGCPGYTGTNDASCTSTVISGGSTTTGSTVMNSCFVEANFVPVIITAGAEKLASPITDLSAGDYLKSVDSALASYNCPARTTMFPEPLSILAAQPPPLPGQTSSAPGTTKTPVSNTTPSNTALNNPSGPAQSTVTSSGGGSWRLLGGTDWEKHYSFTILLGLYFALLGQTLS
jgi:hypothetical protein